MEVEAGADAVRLATWRPDLRADFERLNREWIERWFAVEEEDRRVFDDPAGRIVEPGGQIFFVVDERGVRGTCAVIRHDADTFELAKMAVEPSAQGRGYGDRLVEAAVRFAREAGARRLMLVSNTRLGPALTLYRKHGFRDVPLDPASGYSRADIQLELPLMP
jgi:GNAT superfamily N-acetyltransferase